MRMNFILLVVFVFGTTAPLLATSPEETVVQSERVLSELMETPSKQIPRRLLHEAQAIVVVPNVVKIGFVAGARQGFGVMMERNLHGEWNLPQFITLTGGSIGWQAGVEGTDVVLVFVSRNSVEELMRRKFTLGADASVAAGPIGREAAIGTDSMFKSEIFSYSRSRGLFAGVALDGTSLEVDHRAHFAYYETPSDKVPRRVPVSATDLRHLLTELTPHHSTQSVDMDVTPIGVSPKRVESLRLSLKQSSEQLKLLLSPEWQLFLALPKELQESGHYPTSASLESVLLHFAQVNGSADYRRLTRSHEFQHTYELLREYEQLVAQARGSLQLPLPPTSP